MYTTLCPAHHNTIVAKDGPAFHPRRNHKRWNADPICAKRFRGHLGRRGWCDMIVKTTMLIISNNQQRLGPLWAGDNRFYHLLHKLLPGLHVRRRAIAISTWRQLDEVGIDEGHARQIPTPRQVDKAEFRIIERDNIFRVKGVAPKETQKAVVVLEVLPRYMLVGQKVEDSWCENWAQRT